MHTLDLLDVGECGIIKEVKGEGILRRRLLDMGLTPRTVVEVRKKAPMGDPIEYRLRGYILTLRKEEAARITLYEENEDAPNRPGRQPKQRKNDLIQRHHRSQPACGKLSGNHCGKKGRPCDAGSQR